MSNPFLVHHASSASLPNYGARRIFLCGVVAGFALCALLTGLVLWGAS